MPLAEKITFVGDGAEAAPGITAIAAFGHTPGHMAYHIESGGERLLLWGDTSNHYVMSVQKPDLACRFRHGQGDRGGDPAAHLRHGRGRAHPRDGLSHAFPAIGFVEASRRSSYRWVQTSYQMNL
ncbi:MAG: hypothetical protein R3C69_17240 [Geminicoccaceae bacterium]